MNRIRKAFADEVAALEPVLHETYRRIGMFQKNRTDRNEQRLLAQLDAVAPHLGFFASEVPGPKRAYFAAMANPSLDVSDRIIALDVAVGSLHIEFPVERAYMHRESDALRAALESSRWTDDDTVEYDRDVWLSGVGAAPGVATAPAYVTAQPSALAGKLDGFILVTTMPRPETTPLLRSVAGIVSERGGLLSHAAIVARELGVPCVVGAAGAVQEVRTGELIVIDGDTGQIRSAR